jgi:ketosteroid isomerase-like protein
MTSYGHDSDSETRAFLDDMWPRQLEAERAIHDGDAEPRKALWSHRDPVTLLGAFMARREGWASLDVDFDHVASWFSDCTSYDVQLVAAGASGDLAYTVSFESTSCSVNGEPRSYRLRATHVYRREDGEWRIVHRHADEPPQGG